MFRGGGSPGSSAAKAAKTDETFIKGAGKPNEYGRMVAGNRNAPNALLLPLRLELSGVIETLMPISGPSLIVLASSRFRITPKLIPGAGATASPFLLLDVAV